MARRRPLPSSDDGGRQEILSHHDLDPRGQLGGHSPPQGAPTRPKGFGGTCSSQNQQTLHLGGGGGGRRRGSLWQRMDSPNHEELSCPQMPAGPPLGNTTMPRGAGAESRGKHSPTPAEPARSSARGRCRLCRPRAGAERGTGETLALHCPCSRTVFTTCMRDFVPFYLKGNFHSMEGAQTEKDTIALQLRGQLQSSV